MNVVALWGFLLMAKLNIPKEKQTTWLWGIAFFSVSPFSVLFARKLWAQDLLPLFCLAFWWGHFCRAKKAGAFFWGLAGVVLGQIHMTGFFVAAAALLSTLFSRYPAPIAWRGWFLGTLVGGAGLVPWLPELFRARGDSVFSLGQILHLRFYTHWFGNAFGINLKYSLGEDFWKVFLKLPILLGQPTYGIAILHAFLIFSAIVLIIGYFVPSVVAKNQTFLKQNRDLNFYLGTSFFWTGVLMTLTGVKFFAHYLIVLFPWMQVWLAYHFRGKKPWLTLLLSSQLLISVAFLGFIHFNGGSREGDYGEAFRIQNSK